MSSQLLYLAQRKIPRDESGKPAFLTIAALREIFNDEEIVTLVNRQLVYVDQQKKAHQSYYKRVSATLSPLKKIAKELFGMTWEKLTDEERKVCESHLKGLTDPLARKSKPGVLRPPIRRKEEHERP